MEKVLTVKEAYLAMIIFLEKYYKLTNSDGLGSILGSMQFADDGDTMDPAYWQDWIKSVREIKGS